MVSYALHHLKCLIAILRGDRSALEAMDLSADGFWRSFSAIPLALPAYLLMWLQSARELAAAGETRSLGVLVLLLAVIDLAAWIVPLLVSALALRPMGLASRLVPFVSVQNWFGLLLSYPLAISGWVTPDSDLGLVLLLAIFVVTLIALVHLTRISVGGSMPAAVGLVAIQLAVVLFAFPLYGAMGLASAP